MSMVLEISSLSLESCLEGFSFSSSSSTTYCNLLKLSLKLLKGNSDIVEKSEDTRELLVTVMSRNFLWTLKNAAEKFEEACIKLTHIHVKIFVELQKMLPNNFRGTAAMVETVVAFKDLSLRSQQLSSLCLQFKCFLWPHLHSPYFYATFFKYFSHPNDSQLISLYELSLEVIDKASQNTLTLSAALLTNEETNYCLLLLKSMSQNPHLIHLHPSLYNRLIIRVTQLLYDENLKEEDFQFLEKVLIKWMLSKDFWLGIVCRAIVSEFLIRVKSLETAKIYFLFFEKLMNRIWDPSIEPTNISQVHVIGILTLLLKLHPKLAKLQPETARVLIKESPDIAVTSSSAQNIFLEAFSKIESQPNAQNYYELLGTLRSIARTETSTVNENFTAKFAKLIEMSKVCDWSTFSGLVVAIMDVIISITDDKIKLVYLLKFIEAKNTGIVVPFIVKLKLLEMIFSFVPFANSKIGLIGILTRELNLLLEDDDLILKQAVIEKLSANISDPLVLELKKSLNFDRNIRIKKTEEEELNAIRKSKGFKIMHTCSRVSTASINPAVSHHLQMILKYSQTIQIDQMTETDKKLVQQIASNFCRLERELEKS